MWNIKNCQRNFFKVFEALKRHWKPWEVDTELLKWNWLGENCCVVVKNMSANAEDARDTSPVPRVKKIPLSRKWQPTPVFFPESTMDKGASQAMGSQRVGHNWVHTHRWDPHLTYFSLRGFSSLCGYTKVQGERYLDCRAGYHSVKLSERLKIEKKMVESS